jgi:hypothetical protein
VNLANLRLLKGHVISDALELFQRAERHAYLAQGSGDGNRASSAAHHTRLPGGLVDR